MVANSQTNKYLFLLGIFLLLYTFQSPIRSAFIFATSPLQVAGTFLANSVNGSLNYFFNAGNFQRENGILRLKVASLEAELAQLQEIRRENESLREGMQLNLEKKLNVISAKTILKNPQTDTLLVNKGEIHGVLKGMAVITPENILIGRVGEVYSSYSSVDMISNTSFPLFNAKVATSGLEVVVRGKGNGLMGLEFAPADKAFHEGDILVSTLTGGIFPEGLLVGKISKFKKNDTDPVPTVEVSSDYRFTGSDYVFLVAPK